MGAKKAGGLGGWFGLINLIRRARQLMSIDVSVIDTQIIFRQLTPLGSNMRCAPSMGRNITRDSLERRRRRCSCGIDAAGDSGGKKVA